MENSPQESSQIISSMKSEFNSHIHKTNPVDELVESLCSIYGYDTILKSVSRLWYKNDPDNAKCVGPSAKILRNFDCKISLFNKLFK